MQTQVHCHQKQLTCKLHLSNYLSAPHAPLWTQAADFKTAAMGYPSSILDQDRNTSGYVSYDGVAKLQKCMHWEYKGDS